MDQYSESDDEGEPVVQTTSGMAVASLVLSFFPCGLTSLLGLIFGAVALGKIGSSRGRVGGKGIAIAGICLSSVMLVLSVFIVPIALTPALSRAREAARRAASAQNMAQLWMGVSVAATESTSGNFPADPYTLYPKYIEDSRVFKNPRFATAPIGYVYVSGLGPNDMSSILLYENIPANSRSPGRNALQVGGTVRWYTESEFRQLLDKTKEDAQATGKKLIEIAIDTSRF